MAAEPNRLAWIIGVALSATMFVLRVLMVAATVTLTETLSARPHPLFAPEAKP